MIKQERKLKSKLTKQMETKLIIQKEIKLVTINLIHKINIQFWKLFFLFLRKFLLLHPSSNKYIYMSHDSSIRKGNDNSSDHC